MKKILLLLVLILFTQNIAQSNPMQCKQSGNKISCYMDGQVATSFQTHKISNGLVEIEMCNAAFPVVVHTFPFPYMGLCQYLKATPLEAQNYARQFKSTMDTFNQIVIQNRQKQEEEKRKKTIIVKQISITTLTGKKIALREDGIGDDYLIINDKRVKKFGSRLATYNDPVKYVSMASASTPATFEGIIADEIRADKLDGKSRSYEETIYNSRGLSGLFQLVYRLRVEEGVSLEDAKKLMTFGIDNGIYKPNDLLLLSEIQAIKFQKERSDAYEKLKNVKFPTN